MVIVYQFKCDFPTFSAKLNSETNKNNLALFETSEERSVFVKEWLLYQLVSLLDYLYSSKMRRGHLDEPVTFL